MTTKDSIKAVLNKWGFPILREEECCVVFRFQMCYVQANIPSEGDSLSVGLTLAGFFHASTQKEREMAVRVCNDLNFRLFHAKAFVDTDDDAIITSEYFYLTSEDMEYLMHSALHAIVDARKNFIEKYREVQEEARFLSEIGVIMES